MCYIGTSTYKKISNFSFEDLRGQLKNFLLLKMEEIRDFDSKRCYFVPKMDRNIDFRKNRQFFNENIDPNIDPPGVNVIFFKFQEKIEILIHANRRNNRL
jgi:hypothetical protein